MSSQYTIFWEDFGKHLLLLCLKRVVLSFFKERINLEGNNVTGEVLVAAALAYKCPMLQR